jgi:hypothetical protein
MTAPAISAPASKGRLGNGQLRRQVAEWLAARPGPHTVGEIAKDLGRSAGAVGNALPFGADPVADGGGCADHWRVAELAAQTADSDGDCVGEGVGLLVPYLLEQ